MPHVLDQTGDDERLEQGDGAWLVPPDRYLDQNPPRFDGWQRSSCYVTVRDGTRVAVDVHLPAAREEGLRFPAIVLFTPYYRRFALKEGYNLEVEPSPNAAQFREAFVPYGYAVVVVDVRGTGASFGWRDGFRSPKERGDYYDVVDWIVAQPWSDGAVGATGISYVGAAADFLASTGHKAVKAIVPTFSVWDTWSNHLWPGGVLLTVVPTLYGKLCRAMDLDDREHVLKYAYFADPDFAGPAPVDDDEDGSLLAAAIAEHGRNVDMVGFADALEYRDSALAYDPDYTSASISPYHYAERANDMGTACLGVTGWMDGGGYSTGAIQRYTWQKNPAKRLLIGPWDHGARAHVSPWRRAEALRFALLGEYLRFFDTHLKGLDTGLPEEKPVHYYTMGAEAWQAAATWPPGATATMELFFDEAAKLNPEPPRHGEGVDHHLADFACGSGRQTRYERLYLVVVEEYYPDWTGRDEKMLTFTGPVLEADTEVTGQPVATLHLESSEPDCALFVYLEDLAPDGTCRYVTEGVFRALHRRSGRPPATIPPTGPQHSYLGHDAAPLVPGEVATVAFELLATSYLFRKGHRIRVAIAAADADHFRAISEDRPPRLTVHRGPAHPSRLTLPVVRRGVD